jgi:hypothetical protein
VEYKKSLLTFFFEEITANKYSVNIMIYLQNIAATTSTYINTDFN